MMTAKLGEMAKRKPAEVTAEQQAAAELVRGRTHGSPRHARRESPRPWWKTATKRHLQGDPRSRGAWTLGKVRFPYMRAP